MQRTTSHKSKPSTTNATTQVNKALPIPGRTQYLRKPTNWLPPAPKKTKPKVKISPLAHALLKKVQKTKAKKKEYAIVVHFGEANVMSTKAPGHLSLINLKLWLKQKYKSITKAIVTLPDYSTTELAYARRKTRAERAAEKAAELNRSLPIGSSAMIPA